MATKPRPPRADGDREEGAGAPPSFNRWERCERCGQLLTPREKIRCMECIREEPEGIDDDQ